MHIFIVNYLIICDVQFRTLAETKINNCILDEGRRQHLQDRFHSDLMEVVLQVLHLVYGELQLDVHNSSLCQKLADLIHHIAYNSGMLMLTNFAIRLN